MSYKDFTNPIDIVSQTLTDLRTKPFWDSYDVQIGVAAVSGAATNIIAGGTYTGILLGGTLTYSGDANLAGIISFRLKLDGQVVATIPIATITSLYGVKSSLPIYLSQWNFTGTEAIFQIRQHLHFQVSWELAIISGATANFSLDSLIPVGKNA